MHFTKKLAIVRWECFFIVIALRVILILKLLKILVSCIKAASSEAGISALSTVTCKKKRKISRV